jgi:hypothetical protein
MEHKTKQDKLCEAQPCVPSRSSSSPGNQTPHTERLGVATQQFMTGAFRLQQALFSTPDMVHFTGKKPYKSQLYTCKRLMASKTKKHQRTSSVSQSAPLTEGGSVVVRSVSGNGAKTRGSLSNLGDTEPLGSVAASLLVGSRPHRESEKNPEGDDLHIHHCTKRNKSIPESTFRF